MRRVVRRVLLVGVVAAASGCDQATDSRSPAPSASASSTVATLPPSSTAAVDSSSPALPDSTLAPEPTGVPGIDDPDPFCAAWAVFAGSVQSLAVAAAFGELGSEEMAVLELRAAPAMVAATDTIRTSFPELLAAERDAVLDRVLGPGNRRAGRAVEELTAAGVDAAGLESIRVAWLQSLASRPGDAPLPVLSPLGEPLDDVVTLASRNFDAGVTPYAQDPSLMVSDVSTPLTDAYLAETCPAVAASGVGDSL